MIESFFLLPIVLPPTVVGFILLYLFNRNGLIGVILSDWFGIQVVFNWIGALIAAIVVAFPLMYQSAYAAFSSYDQKFENAALTMGASRFRVFWTIAFPLAWPGLLAGLVLTFARAIGEFGATLMLAGYIPGRTDTVPMTIYFAVQSGNNRLAAIWTGILVILGYSAVLWLNLWSKKKMLKYKRN
ncbi:molybdate transport system permease protein [Amphibacillus cookii]|nr:molybdate transport system permease protein [Amphibacillus cookii]